MILVDANLLIYASSSAFPQHRAAQAWLDRQLRGAALVGLPWASILAFLRTMTNPRIWQHPVPTSDAWSLAAGWLTTGAAWIPQPTERHAEVFGELLGEAGVRGNLVHDADLAALAIEHGLILCSTDRDFARFSRLRWQNPLAA